MSTLHEQFARSSAMQYHHVTRTLLRHGRIERFRPVGLPSSTAKLPSVGMLKVAARRPVKGVVLKRIQYPMDV